ncbi:MAG: excinuclease ABC subunit UvrC [Actinobacteria bacterium]|nr:MAG: excinuclease ABC subunit UvrC [Actinomycetota bacterium]REK40627.1 MAG: excinuclease ABC subunit UvrC [Actinomycetota bacterium]
MFERPKPSEIPDKPGAYLFRDKNGKVIYTGKAKSLRSRVSSYFGVGLHPRTQTMVDHARSVEWIITESEVAALMLEYSLIKKHRPRFNVKLVDDKSYPYLAITRSHEWPRAQVMRGKKRKGNQYFGPYAHTYAIRKTLDQLLRTFPIRTCSNAMFERQKAQDRPCLLYHIEKCSGPCIGAVPADEYQDMVDGLASFLEGDTEGVLSDLQDQMWAASNRQEFELAARHRDRIEDVRRAMLRQEVVTERKENFDLISFHGDELESAFQILYVRQGRVVGRKGTVVDRVEELTDNELMGRVIRELYGEAEPPREVLVSIEPAELDLLTEWLTDLRGSRVDLRVPRRGTKRRLMETTTTNAAEAFARHRLKRQKDHNARARALRSLQAELDLPEPPLRIEAYDISTLQGTNTVASMVVLEDGVPRPSEYRQFKMKTVQGQDDFASMEEAVRRRFKAYLAERDKPLAEQGKFSYPPSLIVIDGGPGQLGRAVRVLDELDLEIPVIGLAKKMEEVYLPGKPEPVQIARDAEALYLLQQVRDEAHRFAVTYHRKLRSKSMVDSILDDVPGIGAKRKRDLIKRFGSLKRIREASRDELAGVVPQAVADDLYSVLHT